MNFKKSVLFYAILLMVGGFSFFHTQASGAVRIVASSELKAINDTTVSGIDFYMNKKGGFVIEFKRQLEDKAMLELSDPSGEIVYSKLLDPTEGMPFRPVEVGKLKAGTYLIEVKTADTTYWTKMKISK